MTRLRPKGAGDQRPENFLGHPTDAMRFDMVRQVEDMRVLGFSHTPYPKGTRYTGVPQISWDPLHARRRCKK